MKLLKKIDYAIRYCLAVVFRIIYRSFDVLRLLFVILYNDITPYEDVTLICFKCGKEVKFKIPVLEIKK